ncbi:MAG: cytochrome c [Campylobacterales bacterium]|nr:cytochrome c [Campylobacterales bacterium]
MKILLTALVLTASALMAQVNEPVEVPYIAYEIKTGKGFDAVQANCLTCHSFGYIINQGPQARAFWLEKTVKMVDAFKAPITPEDVQSIAEYLFTYYGNGEEK